MCHCREIVQGEDQACHFVGIMKGEDNCVTVLGLRMLMISICFGTVGGRSIAPMSGQ